jgi:hypothetical protein
MQRWNEELGRQHVHDFTQLSSEEQCQLLEFLNEHYPPERYRRHREQQLRAMANVDAQRTILNGVTQRYPAVIDGASLAGSPQDLSGCAIMFTAGGEGERLRQSLQAKGYPASQLEDFTKATFALPGFYRDFGALQLNLALVAHLCRTCGSSIPTIVTTGPQGSLTERVIPAIIARHRGFGLDRLFCIAQEERLHLSLEGKIVCLRTPQGPRPATNPDETGGPLMMLRATRTGASMQLLDELREQGCRKILVLQGTAVYDPQLILQMAAAARNHDAIGVGIPRQAFPANDPYGTYVLLEKEGHATVNIIEQGIRNDATRGLKSADGTSYLPYNTGFYVFDLDILAKSSLPDYATPPKEIAPGLARAPKIGYAATDILPLAVDPAILTIAPERFAVIKNDEDLERCSTLGRQFGLDRICQETQEQRA